MYNHISIQGNGYLDEITFPVFKNNYIVVSGCSGGGKTSLLTELAKRKHSVVWEAGRQIIKEQLAINGDALPWVNLEKFLDLALSRYLYHFFSNIKDEKLVFFDRGIVDAIQLNFIQPEYFTKAVENFRYHRVVFLVPPWEEIFKKDSVRQHDFEDAKKECERLQISYKNCGYETIFLPKASIQERVDFILSKV